MIIHSYSQNTASSSDQGSGTGKHLLFLTSEFQKLSEMGPTQFNLYNYLELYEYLIIMTFIVDFIFLAVNIFLIDAQGIVYKDTGHKFGRQSPWRIILVTYSIFAIFGSFVLVFNVSIAVITSCTPQGRTLFPYITVTLLIFFLPFSIISDSCILELRLMLCYEHRLYIRMQYGAVSP